MNVCFTLVLAMAALSYAAPQSSCRPFSGNFTVGVQDLYPESAAFDPQTCKIYISSTANNTLVEYDPYRNTVDIIEFPNITDNQDYLLSGIDYSSSDGHIFISANARKAFFSDGADLSGPNTVIEYNPRQRKVVRSTNLESTIARIEDDIGEQIGGFQDLAEDSAGNVYYMATWGNVLLRIDRHGNTSPFYGPPSNKLDASAAGFGGIAIQDTTLLVSDAISQSFFVFDLECPESKLLVTQPIGLPAQEPMLLCDSLYLPERYEGSVAICASDFAYGVGGISLYYSEDGWHSSEYLGFILNDFTQSPNGTATATFEAMGTIYMVVAYIHTATGAQPQPSNFPFVDITDRVDGLVGARRLR